jgi:hypothetical protein
MMTTSGHWIRLLVAVLLLGLAWIIVLVKGTKEGRDYLFVYVALGVSTVALIILLIIPPGGPDPLTSSLSH